MSMDNKINILLVDDRPENLLALEAIIEHEDYNLVKAFSGEEALKNLLKYDFAAILLDVQMPGMDGFGTAKIIKAREKTKNIPILFITANHMDSEHIFTGYSIGAIDYILKPFDPTILKAKVEGFIEIYKLNQQLIHQAVKLTEKTKELEKTNKDLSEITSKLRISEALSNVISETSIDTMIVIDEAGLILKVNPAIKRMFQYHENEFIGQTILKLFKNEDTEMYIKSILKTIKDLNYLPGNDNLKEVIANRRDGTEFPVEIQIGKRYVQDRCLIAITIRDISNKKHYEEKIKYMAYHDALTDLPNRRLYNQQLTSMLNEARQSNQPLALLYLDMDRFKYINDSLGHIIGDKMLEAIAKRLVASVRDKDLVARVGGDEFNILLPNTDREKALEIAEDILAVCKEPFFVDQYELFITTSIGISIFPFDGEDAQVLMRNGDAALYRAKEQGKNRYKVFHSGMNIKSYKAFILQNDLRKAIEREEFTIVYQPRIDIESGEIRNAEALIRWNHPSWGTISPTEFIPLAEESGKIIEIDEWVLKSVCLQNKAWQQAGFTPIQISVNFSAKQFLRKDLVSHIQQIINETEISPEWLEIEITESAILGNEEIITNTLKQLRKMGIRISIDDFGTGYTSLSYLMDYPVNTIKIDKSFIRDISKESSNSQTLISAIISLSQGLNMSVVAEGVETKEQLEILEKFHCDEAQGYLYSPPVPAVDFERFLTSNDKKTTNRKGVIYLDKKVKIYPQAAIMVNSDETEGEFSNKVLEAALFRAEKLYSISTREMDVFKLLVNGLSNKEISEELFISEHTVKNHITRIFQKLSVNDRLQAMAKVYQICIEEGEILRA
ncbi:EAL domain-containing protein [Neobacillus sp. MM2021_6]|uniref:EAL domain-containing protein n=1 Tax=Bacillaceae TaxID=186817 RepID=UPI001407D27F|nr:MULTISPECIES: EAL domain-containing protein [Bacillaceae]MBO0959006.1 EAL domain-containing protein [Neobacillus sp. MM2021_6]NHC17736.1 EAL domain-containing protein [Bacillus sp. MM2020_4]